MKTRTGIFIVIGIGILLALAVTLGLLVSTANAQGPWQGGNAGGMHNNQALLALLKTTESELLAQRQQGKSWLDIAADKGATERELSDALLQPMTQMLGWMTQNYAQSQAMQMAEWMRQRIAQDMRVSPFGTMTDMHVFGSAMMGNGYGNFGYGGMMHNWNDQGLGSMMNGYGMMGRGMMGGGMMGGWNGTPSTIATPVPSAQKVDREIQIMIRDLQFNPTRFTVQAGETVKLTILNQDAFAHNAVSQDGKLAYTALPANQATSILWVAPQQVGDYTVICTWHPGMQFTIRVE